MKTKVVLTSFALAAATGSLFVACNNEDFVTENGAIEQSGMIELSENFMIGAVGVDNASTRTHWELNDDVLTNVFSPIAKNVGGNNSIPINGDGGGQQLVDAPSIGLCWIGNSGAGEQVYTNYEFFHNGWLGKAQESAVFNPCDESDLTNGWLYSDLKLAAAVADGKEAVKSDLSNVTGSDKLGADGATALKIGEMNLNSGVYKTCNKAIFGGQYIAYYPYNADFKDAGAIPATSVVVFNEMEKNDATDLQLSDNTFRYTNVATINGGTQAEGFGFKNLSGVVRVVLKSADDADLTQEIKTVMLYSPSSSFVKEVLLSPAKIAAGATGTALYSKVVATSKTILVNMEATDNELTVTKEGTDESKVYLTALPAKISDLTVMVQANDDTWAECKIGDFEIAAGEGRELVATYSANDFKNVYYAVDQETLTQALANCNGATKDEPATIKVLGDITLSENTTTVPAWVTIEGDKLIVPEDKTLNLANNSAIKSAVVVEGTSCCSNAAAGGKLVVAGATIYGNVTTTVGEATPAKPGTIEFTADGAVVDANAVIESEGVVNFKNSSNVAIYGTLTLDKDAVANVEETSVVAVKGGTVNNNGTFEVEGDFSMLDAQGTTVASAGKNFKNNGTFIDNVGSKVGGATQYMTFGENGDYICKVDGENRMNEAYENKTACSTIEIISGGTFYFAKAQQHNGKDVNIIVSAASTIFDPAKAITIGKLTVNSGDLRIEESDAIYELKDGDNVLVGYATIIVNGNLDAKAKLVVAGNVRDLQINGDVTIAAEFNVGSDVRNMTAKNLTVVKGGHAKFYNRNKSQDKTLEVSGTIEVQKGGLFTIVVKADGMNIAYVTCTKLVEGGTFSGKPIVVE